MGATRLCFLLFCLFLVSVSSVRRTTVANSCLDRQRQDHSLSVRGSSLQNVIRFRNPVPESTPPPPPPPCRLYNIDDLINTGYGTPKPRHGLQLLFWFARRVDDNQNYIFEPTRGDYGFHYFGNKDENGNWFLPSLPTRQKYYSVGNLNSPGARSLPDYVRKNLGNKNKSLRNTDRLIISFTENMSYDRVFITSHKLETNDHNRSETYEIDPGLILQMRKTSCNNYVTSRTSKRYDEDEEEKDACDQFLAKTKYQNQNDNQNHCVYPVKRRQTRSPSPQCNKYEGIKLEIKTSIQGNLKLIWEIPTDIMEEHPLLIIAIYQNTYSSNANEDPTQVMKYYETISELFGALDTSVPLNAGLQMQLSLYPQAQNFKNFFKTHPSIWSYITNPYIWYGPEFDGANKVIPIRIKGLDASLQLYAKDSKACARLYIKKTFSHWKGLKVLKYSWVGFYKTSQDENKNYSTYQYAVNFAMIDNTTIKNYDIYQYDSSLAIAPGVQIRFLLHYYYNNVLAQTTPWENHEKGTSVCDKGNLQFDPSSPWSFPEFFYEPGFYDANNVIPIKIQMYDAGLQLFTKDGKACARLYIKKTFTDWKDTFYYSWVGFYISDERKTFQYAVNFEKIGDGTKNFDVYQYKSTLDIKPGIHICFMLGWSYGTKLVQTEAWKSS